MVFSIDCGRIFWRCADPNAWPLVRLRRDLRLSTPSGVRKPVGQVALGPAAILKPWSAPRISCVVLFPCIVPMSFARAPARKSRARCGWIGMN